MTAKTSMTPLDILAELRKRNVEVAPAGDKLHLKGKGGGLPLGLKEAIQQHKPALMALLSGHPVEVVFWPGIKAKVYRARQPCLEVGGCLQWSKEGDCDLFPLTWCWGYCRERVGLTVIPGRKEVRSHAG